MFHDFCARVQQSGPTQPPSSTPTEQVAELVARYPNLSEVELARLINLYRQLSALEVALMISDEQLGRKMTRFVTDHRARLKTPFRQYAVLVAIGIIGLAVILWGMAILS